MKKTAREVGMEGERDGQTEIQTDRRTETDFGLKRVPSHGQSIGVSHRVIRALSRHVVTGLHLILHAF